jgi:hypothetical protein
VVWADNSDESERFPRSEKNLTRGSGNSEAGKERRNQFARDPVTE